MIEQTREGQGYSAALHPLSPASLTPDVAWAPFGTGVGPGSGRCLPPTADTAPMASKGNERAQSLRRDPHQRRDMKVGLKLPRYLEISVHPGDKIAAVFPVLEHFLTRGR